jgi:hypothetical protein
MAAASMNPSRCDHRAIVRIEMVTGGGKTFYEAQVTRRGKKSEVKVDASGQPVT